jgi:hypothetical protein
MATLTSINPNHAAFNEGSVLVSVNGTGFTATSKVHVKNVPVQTTFVSATLIRGVLVPSGADSIGEVMVKVEEPASTFTNELPFTMGIHSGEADPGVLVPAADPYPFEYQYVADTNHLAMVVGTVGWPDGADNEPGVGPLERAASVDDQARRDIGELRTKVGALSGMHEGDFDPDHPNA